MDNSEHSNIDTPEKASETSDSVPSHQEQLSGHEVDTSPNGQDPDRYCMTITLPAMKTTPKALQHPVQNVEKKVKDIIK